MATKRKIRVDRVYRYITRSRRGLHLFEQGCETKWGVVYGTGYHYEVERFSQQQLACMAERWGLNRRYGDPTETMVEPGHTLVAHHLIKCDALERQHRKGVAT